MDHYSFFINSYPRSGNTWIRLTLLDVLKAKPVDLNPVFSTRYRFFDTHRFTQIPAEAAKGFIFKSHLMYHKSPQKLDPYKGVYLLRDGRDSLLSYYYYNVKHKGYTESWNDFFDRYFLQRKPASHREKVLLKLMGGWGENVLSYHQRKNVIMIRYEDLLKDPLMNLEKILTFLDIDFGLYKSGIETRLNASNESLNQKAERDKVERKRGSSGSWKDFYSERQQDAFVSRYGDTLKLYDYN